MFYKLTDRADDRRKLLQTGESYHKLSGLVSDILKDLKDKYSESIQHHNLQTNNGFSENLPLNTNSDANSSFHSDEYPDFQNLENLDVKDIEKLLFSHKKEKERFLSA